MELAIGFILIICLNIIFKRYVFKFNKKTYCDRNINFNGKYNRVKFRKFCVNNRKTTNVSIKSRVMHKARRNR